MLYEIPILYCGRGHSWVRSLQVAVQGNRQAKSTTDTTANTSAIMNHPTPATDTAGVSRWTQLN
jgi:hypothetical protein